MTRPETQVSVRKMGRDGEPLVIIDNFSGRTEALLAAGRDATYQPAGAMYPGIRAPADPSYLDVQRPLIAEVMRRVFGFKQSMEVETAAFSVVTLAEDQLAPLQRVPHYDDSKGNVIAVMHYLLGPESGGTAFYRHCRTCFEAITPQRLATYNRAVAKDGEEFGEPEAGFWHGSGQRYELIDEVEARPDRLILYRGRQLHSGVIPDPAALSDDPAKGRLTINMFLRGN